MIKELDEEKFLRLTGVKRRTFDKMVEILEQAIKGRATNKGRKKKLSIENMLFMILEYIREYRTYFHISQSYSVSESNAYKTMKWVSSYCFLCTFSRLTNIWVQIKSLRTTKQLKLLPIFFIPWRFRNHLFFYNVKISRKNKSSPFGFLQLCKKIILKKYSQFKLYH